MTENLDGLEAETEGGQRYTYCWITGGCDKSRSAAAMHCRSALSSRNTEKANVRELLSHYDNDPTHIWFVITTIPLWLRKVRRFRGTFGQDRTNEESPGSRKGLPVSGGFNFKRVLCGRAADRAVAVHA